LDIFEFATTLASFVIAFGVSRLLAGWVAQVAPRSRTTPYPLQMAVSVFILIALLQAAWAMWLSREVIWTFGLFLLLLFPKLALVGAAGLIHPPNDWPASVRDYYFEARKKVCGLCVVWVAGGAMGEIVLRGEVPEPVSVPWADFVISSAIRCLAIAVLLFMAWSDRPSHHWAALGFGATLLILFTFLSTNAPGI